MENCSRPDDWSSTLKGLARSLSKDSQHESTVVWRNYSEIPGCVAPLNSIILKPVFLLSCKFIGNRPERIIRVKLTTDMNKVLTSIMVKRAEIFLQLLHLHLEHYLYKTQNVSVSDRSIISFMIFHWSMKGFSWFTKLITKPTLIQINCRATVNFYSRSP